MRFVSELSSGGIGLVIAFGLAWFQRRRQAQVVAVFGITEGSQRKGGRNTSTRILERPPPPASMRPITEGYQPQGDPNAPPPIPPRGGSGVSRPPWKSSIPRTTLDIPMPAGVVPAPAPLPESMRNMLARRVADHDAPPSAGFGPPLGIATADASGALRFTSLHRACPHCGARLLD